MDKLYVFGGSLAAILLLALAARLLRLGGGRIAGEADAMTAAEEILSGFEAERAAIGSDGQAALVRGRDGSVAVIKVHGARLAARRLASLDAEALPEGLSVKTGDTRFGAVLVRGVTGF